jgi:transcriptional regulator with XRE-family HTH domain
MTEDYPEPEGRDEPPPRPLPLFALRLRRARLNSVYRGKIMTQQRAAAICGVSSTTYARWERGEKLPAPANLAVIADVLNLSVDEAWLDVGYIPPDMQEFLATTREGLAVVKNIRKIMEVMEANQKPATRRGVPTGAEFAKRNRRTVTASPGYALRADEGREERIRHQTERFEAAQRKKQEGKKP